MTIIRSLLYKNVKLFNIFLLLVGVLFFYNNCSGGFDSQNENFKLRQQMISTGNASANGNNNATGNNDRAEIQDPNPPSAGSSTTSNPRSLTSFDPGLGTGTWKPYPNENFWVVDQAGNGIQSNTTYAPGCINNTSDPLSVCFSKTASSSRYGPITLELGNILSIRYQVSNSYTKGEYFQINSSVGSGISYPIEVSLTENPGDFSPPDSGCHTSGFKLSNPRLYIGEGSGQCPLKSNRMYYLNLRTFGTIQCTQGCNFKINEPLSIISSW